MDIFPGGAYSTLQNKGSDVVFIKCRNGSYFEPLSLTNHKYVLIYPAYIIHLWTIFLKCEFENI